VIEAGMSVRGEIAALTSIAEPDVAVVTNVGVAHAEGVGGTRADVMREKHAIFVRPRVVAVGNADDGLTLPVGAVTFGASNGADYRLVARPSVDASGSICEIAAPGGRALRLHLPIPGHAAAIDLTAALAAAEGAVGGPIDPVVVAAALASLAVPHGRGEVRRRSDGMVVLDDTYNANPSSVRAALATLRELAVAESRRAVAVLGEMKELGAASRDLHAAMGDDVAAARVSLVIGCGGLVDLALDRAAAAGVETAKGRDVAEASALARTRVGPNDIVLVKGSRSVGTECIVEELLRAP
jgi:UDP-N-acetylmuramoyl-tripeptide--D-alanyl-D-alanine ligase